VLQSPPKHAFCHLDGPDCINHLDAILGIEKIRLIQWTPAAGQAGALDQHWYPLSGRIRAAGRGLWLRVTGDILRDMVRRAETLVRRYGSHGVFPRLPDMDQREGAALLAPATRHGGGGEARTDRGSRTAVGHLVVASRAADRDAECPVARQADGRNTSTIQPA